MRIEEKLTILLHSKMHHRVSDEMTEIDAFRKHFGASGGRINPRVQHYNPSLRIVNIQNTNPIQVKANRISNANGIPET